MPIASINPATGKTTYQFDYLSDNELEQRLSRAYEAFHRHRLASFAERAAKLTRVADLLEQEQERLARLMVLEMGKPIQQARDEAAKSAKTCRYYALHTEKLLADESVPNTAGRASIRYEPLGPILAIMPWNFPFWQVVRFAAPHLMAGNVGLLKHADSVPQCAQALEDLFLRAGFEPGCFQYLPIPIETIGRVIEDDRVAGVTLTGSVGAGRAVGAQAGKALKPCVLELGGSDPFIVMPSVPLPATVAQAVKGRTQNNGQSCIAAKRFIVHEAIYDEFQSQFIKAFAALKVGDPLDPATQVGPLVDSRALEELDRQVQTAVRAGACLLVGGQRGPGPGFYYPPTILADVPVDCPIYREELFGPVAMLFRARDLDHAIAIANDTPFGLGASLWTLDPAEQKKAVVQISAGQVFLNAIVASQPALAFGGMRQSGHGRELGRHGLHAFMNAKSVLLDESFGR